MIRKSQSIYSFSRLSFVSIVLEYHSINEHILAVNTTKVIQSCLSNILKHVWETNTKFSLYLKKVSKVLKVTRKGYFFFFTWYMHAVFIVWNHKWLRGGAMEFLCLILLNNVSLFCFIFSALLTLSCLVANHRFKLK